jgi:hypothetical protein
MDRSIYPNGVLVTQSDLRRTEETKIAEILKNRVDSTTRGVLTGGAVSVNLTNSDRLDITAFTGYVPRGDKISSSLTTYNQPLVDYTNGTQNYICAVYTEVASGQKPHESDGTTYSTAMSSSYRISVYTNSDFENIAVLPESDDNLANDARDRCLILAIVTANGSGVALTASSIQSPTEYNSILYPNPVSPTDIAGLDIMYVDPDMDVGNGLIEYQYVSGDPDPYQIRWTSPGGSAGSWVKWSTDGSQNVAGSSGNYLTVNLALSQMATTGTFPITATIVIANIYGQTIPRFSAQDYQHRNLLGTGKVSPENPHGMSLNDLASETLDLLDEHQDVMHCNGIWKGSLSSTLSTSVTVAAGYDILYVNAPTNVDKYYINGKLLSEIDTSSIVYDFLSNTSHLTEVYVTDKGTLHSYVKASYPAIPRNLRGTWIIGMSDSYTAGSYDLVVVVSGSTTLTYTFSWDGGATVDIVQGENDQAIRLFSDNGKDYIDLWVHCSVTGGTDEYLQTSTGTYTDSITVVDSFAWTDKMLIAQVPYWYDSLHAQGNVGFAPYAVARANTDKRIWGNLCESNISDVALDKLIYKPATDFNFSGVLSDSLDAESFSADVSSGLTAVINGGISYCRGKRLTSIAESLALSASTVSMVYIDTEGVIQFLDVTATFSGDIDLAFQYLVGNSYSRLNVSDSYHASKVGKASPERGVPLYILHTDSTSITETHLIYRNINKVSDPWTVGIVNVSDINYTGAFKTLEAAFLHAKAYKKKVEVKVVGSTTENNDITQPANVYVKGFGFNSSISLVGSSWDLSNGSKVEGVNISGSGSSYLLGLNTNIIIRECLIDQAVIPVFGDQSVSTINNVVLDNNTINANMLTDSSDFGSTTFENWKIINNLFECYSDTLSDFISLTLNKSLIAGNNFTNYNGSNFTKAISISGSTNLSILNNKFYIGEGAQSDPTETAVWIEDALNCIIKGNYFTRESTSTSKATTGLILNYDSVTFSNLLISENTFENINRGIHSTAFKGTNVIIVDNQFSNIHTSAIKLSVSGTFNNIDVKGNNIYNLSEDTSTVIALNKLEGITLTANVSAIGAYWHNIKVSDNIIRSLYSSSYAPKGIGVDGSYALATIDSVSINDNKISRMYYTGTEDALDVIAINLEANSNADLTTEIRNNFVDNFFSSNDGIILRAISATIGGSTDVNEVQKVDISNNNILGLGFNAATVLKRSDAIYLQGYTSSSVLYAKVSNNVIQGTSGVSTFKPRLLFITDSITKAEVFDNNFYANQDTTTEFDCDGIYCQSENSKIINNKIEIPYGTAIYSVNNSVVDNLIKDNVISSQYRGINAKDGEILNNRVSLMPDSTNDLPVESYAIHNDVNIKVCKIIGNHTSTSDEVYTIGGNTGDDTYVSYHIFVENLKGFTVSVSGYIHTIKDNYIDLISQGYDGVHIMPLNGLVALEASSNTYPATLEVTGNTFSGGNASNIPNSSGLLVPLTGTFASKAPLTFFTDCSSTVSKSVRFLVSGNNSIANNRSDANFPSPSKIYVATSTSLAAFISMGSNYDDTLIHTSIITGLDNGTW